MNAVVSTIIDIYELNHPIAHRFGSPIIICASNYRIPTADGDYECHLFWRHENEVVGRVNRVDVREDIWNYLELFTEPERMAMLRTDAKVEADQMLAEHVLEPANSLSKQIAAPLGPLVLGLANRSAIISRCIRDKFKARFTDTARRTANTELRELLSNLPDQLITRSQQ